MSEIEAIARASGVPHGKTGGLLGVFPFSSGGNGIIIIGETTVGGMNMRAIMTIVALLTLAALLAACESRPKASEPETAPQPPTPEAQSAEQPDTEPQTADKETTDAEQQSADKEAPDTEPQNAEPKTVTLYFDSFDGGGPEYRAEVAEAEIISCTYDLFYAKPDHETMTGAGYTVTYTLRGLKPGETTVTIRARSPIAENFDAVYRVTVDEALNVAAELAEHIDRLPGYDG